MAINFNRVPGYVRKEISPPGKVINNGSYGSNVQRIQEWLQAHDFSTEIDGKFGPATSACVKGFQESADLKPTGSVNNKTWQALVKPMALSLREPEISSMESPQGTVLRVAKQHLAQKPIEIGGPNCGPWVRLYCGGNNGPEWAWCAGFVTLIMQQAYFYREQKVPIEGSVSCDSIAAQAKREKLFVSGRSLISGKADWADFGNACIFLKRRTSTDWTHTGFAHSANAVGKEIIFQSIEGNTNNNGSRDGFKATARTRSLSGGNYDFVHLKAAQDPDRRS